jgi:glycosyltransferase involved in cell wall biosynthesis
MAKPKKVLIVSYYWPPSGGVGVQRWLKLAKYLPEWGWEPIILTPENPAFSLQDPSLQKDVRLETEVLRLPIWEPYGLLEKLKGEKTARINQGITQEGEGAGLFQQGLMWVRGNFFLPDPRRFWVKPASDFILRILETNQISAIITTGPPHSMHLIGQRVKKKSGIAWLADFRDPWSRWEILQRMKLTAPARWYHQRMEKQVLGQADLVLSASYGMEADFRFLCPEARVQVLTNGVDEADLPEGFSEPQRPDKFRLVYAGLLNDKRNPALLWKVLDELCLEQESFADALEISLTGNIGQQVLANLEQYQSLKECLRLHEPVPHKHVFELYKQAAVLLLLIDNAEASRVIIPAKLFEYMAACKPILYIGEPLADAGQIIRNENCGQSFNFQEEEAVKAYIWQLFLEYTSGEAMQRSPNWQAYTRRLQAKELGACLDKYAGEAEKQK